MADRKFFVRTFGCQMNEHDSQRITALLADDGLTEAASEDDADVVVLNTCCIRENADNKLYGTLGHLKTWKAQRDERQIVVSGCLAQKDRDIVREQDQIHVLRAEWAYLDRPERIEDLANKYLSLAAPKANQLGSIAQLPMRGETPLDPMASTPAKPAGPNRGPAPLFAPTPVAAGSRPQSRPVHPNELSVGLNDSASLPGGGR